MYRCLHTSYPALDGHPTSAVFYFRRRSFPLRLYGWERDTLSAEWMVHRKEGVLLEIQSVETFPLYVPLREPYGDANGYKSYRSSFVIRIQSRSGLEGWGECAGWLPVLEKVFKEHIIPFLLGKKSTDRMELVKKVRKWYPGAAAGVSMALTEILAKMAGVHVCDVWGGMSRRKIPVYASFQSYTNRSDWRQHSVNMVEEALTDGYTSIKVKIGAKTFQEDRAHIGALLNLVDNRVNVAIDANESYDVSTALRWNRLFAQWDNWLWFEEPVPMDNVSEYRVLRSRCQIPVSGGENIQGAALFLPLAKNGSLDIIQPDVNHTGGVDAFREALQLARHFGLRASPHCYDGALSRLYAAFAMGCLPSWSKMEEEDIEPVEWDVMENPLNMLLPLKPVDGFIALPSGTGIGIELDKELLKTYRWNGLGYV